MPRKKETDVHDGALGKGNAFELSEIGDPGPIEKVSETDFVDVAKLEEFMNQLCTIVMAPSTEDAALEIETPQVNGINQPIIRGVPVKVKRKYVEALARNRLTRYEQQTPDPTRPESIQMIERTAIKCPFTVIEDPAGDVGREWLKAIIAQP